MPILLIYLGYLIVRYKAFDLRIFGAQGLVLALIDAVTPEQIADVAREFFAPERQTVVSLGPGSEF